MVYKYKGIRKSEFVAKTQFLYKFIFISRNLSNRQNVENFLRFNKDFTPTNWTLSYVYIFATNDVNLWYIILNCTSSGYEDTQNLKV